MNFKIKKHILEQLISKYEQEIINYHTNESDFIISIQRHPNIDYLFPYFLINFKEDLIRDFHSMRDGFEPIKKLNHDGDTIIIKMNEPFDEANDIIVKDIKYCVMENFEQLRNSEMPIVEGVLNTNEIICDSFTFPFDWFETSKETIIECKVLSNSEWRDLKRTNPQAYKIKYNNRNDFSFSSNELEYIYIVLLKNKVVIGLSECCIRNNSLQSSFSSILENEQGKGYSSLLLETKIQYAQSRNLSLTNSAYTSDGFFKLRPKILNLCNKYNVSLTEGGLHKSAKTIEEEIYSTQHELREKIKSCQLYNSDMLHLPGFKTVSIKEYEEKINKFLNINPYDFKTQEDLEKDWNFFMIFLDEKYINRILNNDV